MLTKAKSPSIERFFTSLPPFFSRTTVKFSVFIITHVLLKVQLFLFPMLYSKHKEGQRTAVPLKPVKSIYKKERITMKRNAIITIDATHAQVTQAFAKQARIFGTSEYKEWRAYCQDFPGAEMVTKTIKKAKNKKNDAKNRTYKKMAEYIDCQENADALKKEFEAQKKLSIVQKSPYRFVLNSFLATFPELKENEDKESEAVAPAADQIEAAEPQELPIAS